MNQEKLYLDQKGYQDYLEEIEKLKEELNRNSAKRAESYQDAVGDGWHDNFDFEVALREEYKIMGMLEKKQKELEKIVIIEPTNNIDQIDINQYVTVKLLLMDEEEELSFKLVASLNPKEDEISLNSPIGRAIYGKKAGDKVSYRVLNKEYSVIILNNY